MLELLGNVDTWHQLNNSEVAQTIKQGYSKVTIAQSSHSDDVCSNIVFLKIEYSQVLHQKSSQSLDMLWWLNYSFRLS